MLLKRNRLSPLYLLFMIGICFGVVRAVIITPLMEFSSLPEKYFALVFTYLFSLPIGFITLRIIILEFDRKYHLTVDPNTQTLKIVSRFSRKVISLLDIDSIELNNSVIEKEQFKNENIKMMDQILQKTVLNFTGRNIGASFSIKKGNKVVYCLKGISTESIPALKKLIAEIGSST